MTIGDSEPCDPSPRPPVRPSAGGHQHGAVYYDHTVFVPAWSGTIYLDQPAGAGAGAIAPEHNWADAQTVEAESPPVDIDHCWRCEVATVSREDEVGLCGPCKTVLRDLTTERARPVVREPGRVALPFPRGMDLRSGDSVNVQWELAGADELVLVRCCVRHIDGTVTDYEQQWRLEDLGRLARS